MNKVKVEFLQDFRSCRKKGDIEDVSPDFAHALKEAGIAKIIDGPARHKMVESPRKAKGHNIAGYTG